MLKIPTVPVSVKVARLRIELLVVPLTNAELGALTACAVESCVGVVTVAQTA